ncbi:MAG: ABC transporter permease [Curvibacter sp.]
MTLRVVARLHGYLRMVFLALARWDRLAQPTLRVELSRQVHALGIAALPVTGALAALMGAAAVTQLTALAGQSSDSAQSWLFYGLFFELAPLLSALVLVARSSAAMAAELAVMQQHDEYVALRRMGIAPADYLLLPRMLACALVLPAITIFFQLVSVFSGWLAVSLLQGLPLWLVAGHFLALADPWLTLLSLGKSALMGLLVGAIACHHGSSRPEGGSRDVSQVTIHAVGNGMVAVFLVDVLVALLVYWAKQ